MQFQHDSSHSRNFNLSQMIDSMPTMLTQNNQISLQSVSMNALANFHELEELKLKQLKKKLSTVFEESASFSSEPQHTTFQSNPKEHLNHQMHWKGKKSQQNIQPPLMKKIYGLRKQKTPQQSPLVFQNFNPSFKPQEDAFHLNNLPELENITIINQNSGRKHHRKGLSICSQGSESPRKSEHKRTFSFTKPQKIHLISSSPYKRLPEDKRKQKAKLKGRRWIQLCQKNVENSEKGLVYDFS